MTDPASGGLASARVLVVDDEPLVRRAVSRVLTSAGYVVTAVADVTDAIEALQREAFDVLLSDILLRNGESGLALLQQARALDPDLPTILITGTPSIETAVRAVEYGALRYLTKPIDSRLLVMIVADAWRLRRMAALKREAARLFGSPEKLLGDRESLGASFRRGVEGLWMAFQPIVLASSVEVFGYEALLRTTEPTIPHPGAFLAAGEQLGRLSELGRAVRASVAGSAPLLPGSAAIFVNLHTQDLLDPELFDPASPLAAFASRVVLEITERAALDDVKDASSRIAKLRSLGYRIAVDDLGAGYAGLTSFAQLTPDVVKLDMSLVRGVHEDNVKRKLIGSMTQLCKEMGMQVVAEGIETEDERRVVVELGCDLLQGYLFGRPARLNAA